MWKDRGPQVRPVVKVETVLDEREFREAIG
jgi:hypothetical protein